MTRPKLIRPHRVIRISPFSGQENIRTISYDEYDYNDWQNGMVIQNAMPYLTPGEREFLMTGITEEEWDDTFKK